MSGGGRRERGGGKGEEGRREGKEGREGEKRERWEEREAEDSNGSHHLVPGKNKIPHTSTTNKYTVSAKCSADGYI